MGQIVQRKRSCLRNNQELLQKVRKEKGSKILQQTQKRKEQQILEMGNSQKHYRPLKNFEL